LIPARYSLIRYIPDAARGEQLNIGILAWTEHNIVLELDDRAVERVIRENPHLAKDSLRGLRETLLAQATESSPRPQQSTTTWLSAQRGYPVVATEDRHTTVAADTPEALGEAVERLVKRVVRPRRRGGGAPFDAGQVLERELRPLLRSQRIVTDYTFENSRSGVARRVDYFANSDANVALDVVKLAVKSADEVMRRADAEAFKIEDIRHANHIDAVVFCVVSTDDAVHDVTENAEQVIASVGARIVTNVDDAAAAMASVVG
jgi:hypothetical protein